MGNVLNIQRSAVSHPVRRGERGIENSSDLADACSADNLSGCNSIKKCDEIGYYWYDNRCNEDKHPNQAKIEEMTGLWRFEYNYTNTKMIDYYYFDINRVYKVSFDNSYIIYGFNIYTGDSVTAVCGPEKADYFPIDVNCTALDSPNEFMNKHYVYDFVNNDELSGVFFNTRDNNWQENYYDMKGYRLPR